MESGVLVINKPSGITSHDVVAKVRRALQTKKVGHTGTLDPMATGVLVVCVGAATKLVQYLTCESKIYEVEMKLGVRTDTGDITGTVIEEAGFSIDGIDKINNVMSSFIGMQKQVPPMYSAIKIDGVKLYELARKGMEIEREARDIEIFSIDKVEYFHDVIKFRVYCSKGTYVRVLCEDIAKAIGTVGTMTGLNRVKTGDFGIDCAVDIEEISEDKIISIEKLFDKKIYLEKDVEKLLNGISLSYDLPDGLYSLYTNHFIGIGKIIDKKLKREIIL